MNTRTSHPDWADIVDEYTEAYGTTPGTILFDELGALYQRHPTVTVARLREAHDAHIAGRIHSPWGFVREAMRKHDTARAHQPQATTRERDTAIHLAERWLHNAGLYCPTAAEAEDEIFDAHPTTPPSATACLAPWSDDLTLRERIRNEWERHQPRAEQANHEKLERAAAWKAGRARQAEPATPAASPDADLPL